MAQNTANKSGISRQAVYEGKRAGRKLTAIMAKLKKDKFLYMLAFPGLVFFLIFKYLPMWGVIISFQNYSPYLGFFKSPWAGLEHFTRFFGSPEFSKLFRNTTAINLLNLIFFFPMPVVLSLLLNELKFIPFKRVIQCVLYLPHFLSWVIIVGISFLLLSQSEGIINKMLIFFGFQGIDFLTNPHLFWILLTVQSIWKETGWGTIIFLAAISGVDPLLYEAARMDGASRFRQAWHITLPAIRSVIVILFILRLGHIMDVGFEQVFLMRNGVVSEVAEVFDTYAYRLGIQQAQFSFATAVGLFKSVVGLLLVIVANRLAKWYGDEGVY